MTTQLTEKRTTDDNVNVSRNSLPAQHVSTTPPQRFATTLTLKLVNTPNDSDHQEDATTEVRLPIACT